MSAAMKIQDSEQITLTYDLFDLPSAQHKAGLVGLILLRDSLREREVVPLPNIETKGSVVSVTLSKESLDVLMRDAYAGFSIKTPTKKKAPKKAGAQVASDNGSQEEKERVFPKGTVIERLLHGGSNSPWLKLWCEMVVRTIKIRTTAQAVYKKDESLKKIIDDLWAALPTGSDASSVEIASSLLLGAESTNAELVGFKNRSDHKFLLHFWPLSSIVYVPRFLVRETRNGETEWKESLAISDKRRGPFFVIVIPDVMNIVEFPAAMKEYIQRLDDDRIWRYRPAGAVVDLPEEAAIDFIFRMMRRRVGQEDLGAYVNAVQVFYVESVGGKSARILSEATIKPNRRVLAEYEELQDRRLNPHYKSLRIRNVLSGNRWHHGADSLFSHYPFEHFIWTKSTPSFPFFGDNVKRYFTRLDQQLNLLKENNAMNETDPAIKDDVLARRIYRLIGEYVNYKTDVRSRVKYKDLPRDAEGHKIYPKEFREAREKVTNDAFLAMRSRRAEDFVEYFTGTICSVPHFVQEPEYLDLTHALIQTPETVKNLSMLALSAYSYLPGKEGQSNSSNENQDQGETK